MTGPLCRSPKFLEIYRRAAEGQFLDECWAWPETQNARGYGVIWLNSRQYVVTRIVLGIEYEDRFTQAAHRCDNPPCVNPAHLFVATIRENQQDKGVKGRAARGVDNRGGDKLTEADVLRIRELLSSPERLTMASIAREFGVSRTMIGYIKSGKLWSHV